MSKICIILNAADRKQMKARLKKLYGSAHEIYFVDFAEGFSNLIQTGTTEILFAGGSNMRLKDHPTLRDEAFAFIEANSLPMLGICFGAQLLARALGARIVQLPVPRVGLCPMRILRDKECFNGKYIAHVYKSQVWSLQDLPVEFILLGCSAEGIEMFMHATRPIAGVQFHPEQFTRVNDGKLIFKTLRTMLLERR